MVVSGARVERRRECGSAGGTPLRRGNGRSSRGPPARGSLWRRSRATQRARGAAPLRRNGVEVWQPGAGDAGSSQERPTFPASAFDLLLSQGRYAATRGGFGGQASRRGVAGKLSRAGRPEAGSRLGGFGRIRFRSI